MRAFNYWLLTECHSVLASEQSPSCEAAAAASTDRPGYSPPTSPFVRRRKIHTLNSNELPYPPLELDPSITIYLYCTCAPCGDASMELCMAAQEDSTPWEIPPNPDNEKEPSDPTPETDLLDGRAHFSRLGVVRRKPARVDAESTRSKSCSDKLALREVSSLLSHETSLLVAPTRNAYLAGLVLPEREVSLEGCERSFGGSGRMNPLAAPNSTNSNSHSALTISEGGSQEYGYRFHPFRILSIPSSQVDSLWAFGKPPPPNPSNEGVITPKKSKPSNVSVVWVSAATGSDPVPPENGTKVLPSLRGSRTGLYENLINGVRQGSKASSVSGRGASGLSRAKLWSLLHDTLLLSRADSLTGEGRDGGFDGLIPDDWRGIRQRVLEASTYCELKQVSAAARRDAIHDARRVLKGWIRNLGDEDWGLDILDDSKKRKRDQTPDIK